MESFFTDSGWTKRKRCSDVEERKGNMKIKHEKVSLFYSVYYGRKHDSNTRLNTRIDNVLTFYLRLFLYFSFGVFHVDGRHCDYIFVKRMILSGKAQILARRLERETTSVVQN